MTDNLEHWLGQSLHVEDSLHPFRSQAMVATLAGIQQPPAESGNLPPLWHWLYFLDTPAQTDLAADGHERRGRFLPPVELPRRMWAASAVKFHQPLTLNTDSSRESVIESIERKTGKSGDLVFVSVLHQIHQQSTLAITERQTIVYRGAAAPEAPRGAVVTEPEAAAPGALRGATVTASKATAQKSPPQGEKVTASADFAKTFEPDMSLLFRYSALTFNAHRIHYDRDYARDTEGYPGLVVHGPLLATLLLGLLQEQYPNSPVQSFSFRAMKPVFDTAACQICGQHPDSEGNSRLWIADSHNELCMRATARIEP